MKKTHIKFIPVFLMIAIMMFSCRQNIPSVPETPDTPASGERVFFETDFSSPDVFSRYYVINDGNRDKYVISDGILTVLGSCANRDWTNAQEEKFLTAARENGFAMEFDLKMVENPGKYGLAILFGMQSVQPVMNDYIGFLPDHYGKSEINLSSDRNNQGTLVDYDHLGNWAKIKLSYIPHPKEGRYEIVLFVDGVEASRMNKNKFDENQVPEFRITATDKYCRINDFYSSSDPIAYIDNLKITY